MSTAGRAQKIMLYVLKHYQFFAEGDKSFRKTLKSLAFLPKGDMLLTPDRFYDPDHELLQKLFLFEENFPGAAFSDPAMVMVLRDVGLRGVEDVEPEDLQEAAFTVQNLYSSSDQNKTDRLVEKSEALLEYLHRHKSRLKAKCSGTTLAIALSNICWVRGLTTRPGTSTPTERAMVPAEQRHLPRRPSERDPRDVHQPVRLGDAPWLRQTSTQKWRKRSGGTSLHGLTSSLSTSLMW